MLAGLVCIALGVFVAAIVAIAIGIAEWNRRMDTRRWKAREAARVMQYEATRDELARMQAANERS